MKKYIMILFALANCIYTSYGQENVGINTATPDPSAALHVEATDKGVLIPRLTTEQRQLISNAATGLLVFDTDTGSFWFYKESAWVDLSAPAQLADADGDTKIEVERFPDEDIIRMSLDATERLVLRKNNPIGNQLLVEFPNNGENLFLGTGAGASNTTGGLNTFLGFWAGLRNTEGGINTFVGRYAGTENDTGSGNTFLGHETGNRNKSGGDNTFLGSGAGLANQTGNRNVYVGLSAGLFGTAGSNNVFLGFEAGKNEQGSHRLYIESSDANSANALIYGEFDNDLLRVNGQLDVSGNVTANSFLGDGSQLTGLLPAGPQAGDITYYDGSAWQRLPKGLAGQMLTLKSNGTPVWAGKTTEGLLEVTLPNGEILYVHPTDNNNSPGILWGQTETDILDLPNLTSLSGANMDLNGESNTQAIVNQLQNYAGGSYAAKLCADLVAFGFDDWYLPAAGELNIMRQQLFGPGGNNNFAGTDYWSSTEFGAIYAWGQSFVFGGLTFGNKGNEEFSCRCVRR